MKNFFKLIFSGIKAFFRYLFLGLQFVYRLLKALKMRILALYLIVCGLLQLIFHLFDGKVAFFFVGLALCLLLTLWGWVRFLKERRMRKRLNEATEDGEENEEPDDADAQTEEIEAPAPRQIPTPPKRSEPKFYAVEGHPNYYFTEYADRYELYYRSERGYEYIRTDYKTEKS